MAVYTVLHQQDLNKIVADYGLGSLIESRGIPAGSVNTLYFLETTKGRFFLRIDEVKSRPEVRKELDLLLFLRRHRFPCPQPLPDKKGRLIRELWGKSLSLYRYIDGEIFQDLTLPQLYHVGKVLGQLHRVGKAYKKTIENRFSFERVMAIYCEMRRRLPSHLKKVVRTLDEEFGYLSHFLEKNLPTGIIHADLFADNLIFRGEKVVAVLDFEAACRGKFLFDLATAVNALCYKDGFVLERFKALLSGYSEIHPLTPMEWDAFPNELRFSALRFTVTRLRDFFLNPVDPEKRQHKDFREFFARLQILRREREGGIEGLLRAMVHWYDED